MIKRLFAITIVTTASLAGSYPALAQDGLQSTSQAKAIPCTCRFQGTDIPVGQTMCLDLPSGDVLAVCDRVLNNTAWKPVQQGCTVPGLS